jgi:hypothetical protein
MGRPSKLSPEQWAEIERRIAGGEVLRDLAAEFGISPAAISRKGFTQQSKRVQAVAQQVADAQTALAELPVPQQYAALTMADELRGLSVDMLGSARLGAKNSYRLNSLANSELQKVDDADPMASAEALKGVAVLTKMANDAAATPLNLLNANRERMKEQGGEDEADKPRGVLVVPGLMTDGNAWAQQAQAAAKGTE